MLLCIILCVNLVVVLGNVLCVYLVVVLCTVLWCVPAGSGAVYFTVCVLGCSFLEKSP